MLSILSEGESYGYAIIKRVGELAKKMGGGAKGGGGPVTQERSAHKKVVKIEEDPS